MASRRGTFFLSSIPFSTASAPLVRENLNAHAISKSAERTTVPAVKGDRALRLILGFSPVTYRNLVSLPLEPPERNDRISE
jgi:hypothetical protein